MGKSHHAIETTIVFDLINKIRFDEANFYTTLTGKKNVETVFRSIYNFKMDHNSRRDARLKCPRKRPDDLIQKYERINIGKRSL